MQKTKAKTKPKIKAAKARKPAAIHTHIKRAKRLIGMTPKFVHGMVTGAFVGLMVVTFMHQASPTSALSMNVSRDCTANAVIKCGAITTDELKSRYSQAGVAAIYAYYGIGANDIKNIGSTAVAGLAYKDGTVKINSTGETVATGSASTGRQAISGSTRISYGGVTFYETASTRAFRANSLPVYVVMSGDQFKFAVIPNCANPIRATPVVKPKPPATVTPTPTPTPAPTPTPTPTPPTITEVTPAPPETITPAPIPVPVVSAETTSLPATGPSDVLIIGLLAIIGGYIFHVTHRHVRHRRKHTLSH